LKMLQSTVDTEINDIKIATVTSMFSLKSELAAADAANAATTEQLKEDVQLEMMESKAGTVNLLMGVKTNLEGQLNQATEDYKVLKDNMDTEMSDIRTGTVNLLMGVRSDLEQQITSTTTEIASLNRNVDQQIEVVNKSIDEQVTYLQNDLRFTVNGLFRASSYVDELTNTTEEAIASLQSRLVETDQKTKDQMDSLVRTVIRTSQTVQDHEQKTVSDMLAIGAKLESDVKNLEHQTTTSLHVISNQLHGRLATLEMDRSLSKDNAAPSSVFVRWGRSMCPASSEKVYSGVVGGGLYSEPGASSSVLCLPDSPELEDTSAPATHANLYGSQYTTDLQAHQDAVCSVCRSPRPTSVMIPARESCQDGWTLEYKGYLMGGHPDQGSGQQYVCVDSAMEGRAHSGSDHEGLRLYYTYTKCGSLPCPEYQEAKAVTCVVCSK